MKDIESFLADFFSKSKPVPKYYGDIIEFVKLAKSFDDDNLNEDVGNVTPQFLIDFRNKLSDHANTLDSLYSLREFKPVEWQTSYEEAKNECEEIKKSTKGFKAKSGLMEFIMEKTEMYDPYEDITFNFGDFHIFMYVSNVLCKPAKDNTINADRYYHPYVGKDYKLCMGEYDRIYKNCMKQGRFLEAFSYVDELMRNYGGNDKNGTEAGPHMSFGAWGGVRCAVCDESFLPSKGGFSCATSQKQICMGCGDSDVCKDSNTGLCHLPQFLKECKSCDIRTINVRGEKCSSCRANQALNS